jgi:hypothetical protein
VRLEKGWGHVIDWQPLTRFRVESGDEMASVSHGAADAPVLVQCQFDHNPVESEEPLQKYVGRAR